MSGAPARPASPVLFDRLLLAEGTVGAARDAVRAWFGELAGPLLVAAPATGGVLEQLSPADHGLPVVLVAQPSPGDPAGLAGLREARNQLLDDDRLELTGVHVPLPAGVAVPDLLAGLALSVPAWVEVPAAPGWERALAALAEDGAEHLAVRLPPDAATPRPDDLAAVAAVLRRGVELGLTSRVTGAGGAAASPLQLLAALCTVRAALDGDDAARLAALLGERDVGVLAATLRNLGPTDAGAVRQVLDGVVVRDVEQTARDLAALGLADPSA
jgi:hypothetical protein